MNEKYDPHEFHEKIKTLGLPMVDSLGELLADKISAIDTKVVNPVEFNILIHFILTWFILMNCDRICDHFGLDKDFFLKSHCDSIEKMRLLELEKEEK